MNSQSSSFYVDASGAAGLVFVPTAFEAVWYPLARGVEDAGPIPVVFTPGMLSGTVCGLLLLCGGLAVALVMTAFPRLILLTLGSVPLLVSLLATYETLLVVVPTNPLCFHISSLGILA